MAEQQIPPAENQSSSTTPVSLTLLDPDVLECPICCEPLKIPIFQCENGHLACFQCCEKVKKICPSCKSPNGYSRCRAMEKVIEAYKNLRNHIRAKHKDHVIPIVFDTPLTLVMGSSEKIACFQEKKDGELVNCIAPSAHGLGRFSCCMDVIIDPSIKLKQAFTARRGMDSFIRA
ncbi:hypothetical protein DY000_02023602 [Brassica cretica]|uniref:RING-type domain-containing protein n=1 Tax=Brassica cretica TaxID=69181 RepID=A0ABQ7EC40_BRACR|nr:hypothetical protein DY000_02023602 [Brassica cretica]